MISTGGASKSKKQDLNDDEQKLYKYCNIIRYIESNDHQLFKVIYDLCMFPSFGSKNGQGITFLFPRSTGSNDLRSRIIKDAYSPNIKNAYTLVNSCIIRMYIPETREFLNTCRIVNGNCEELKVVDSSEDTITLNNGFTIIKDNNFQLLHSGSKYAVYNIVSETPTSGKPKMSVSIGSYEGGAPSEFKERYAKDVTSDVKVDIRNVVLKSMYTSEADTLTSVKVGDKIHSNIKRLADSLLSYAKSHDENWGSYSDQIPTNYWSTPFMVAWIIPYKTTKSWSEMTDDESKQTTMVKIVKDIQGNADQEFIKLRNDVQNALVSNVGSSLYDNVINVYKTWVTGGDVTINETKFTFKPYSVETFSVKVRENLPIALLAHHECMHFTGFIKDKIGTMEAKQLLDTSKRVFLTGNSPTVWITDAKVFKSAVGNNYELLCMLLRFVNSQCFMYRTSCVAEYSGDKIITGGRPDSIAPTNESMADLQFADDYVNASKF